MRVAVLGAGAGGAAAVAELTQAGHAVHLWNRSPATLEPFQRIGGVAYAGVLGEGLAKPDLISADLAKAIDGCDALLCTLPTISHAAVAVALAQAGARADVPVVLNPGHTGGALEFAAVFRRHRAEVPPIAEFSTLTYVARKLEPQRVTVSGRARQVRVAALPGGERAVEVAQTLFACAKRVADVLASGLANVNMVLHPPGAILGAAWIEASRGDYTFYAQGMTPGVARVMRALDEERRAVARACGHELPNLIEEMQAIGTVEAGIKDSNDFAAAISAGAANSCIKAPGSLDHRYYLEDFGHGLLPFMAFAEIAGVAVPAAENLFRLAEIIVGKNYRESGRSAAAMGIAGLDRKGLLARVRKS
jgi:opine dehydrogenase